MQLCGRVAGLIRRHAHQQMGGAGERRGRVGERTRPVEDGDLEPVRPQCFRRRLAPRRPGHGPAARAQAIGEHPGAIAEAENEQARRGVGGHGKSRGYTQER